MGALAICFQMVVCVHCHLREPVTFWRTGRQALHCIRWPQFHFKFWVRGVHSKCSEAALSSVVTQLSGSRFLQDNVLVFCFSIKSSYYQIIFSMFSLQSHEHTFWIILGSPWFGLFSIMDATGSYFSTPATAGSLHLADNWYLSTSWFFFWEITYSDFSPSQNILHAWPAVDDQSPLFRYSLSLLENLAHQQDKHSVHITYYYVFTLAIM
jgi:hypothetical protein